ncbi:MAG: CAP domain-containing protein [Devosia sp.]|nr:CAP domain-containing protein [Devosia sp.]
MNKSTRAALPRLAIAAFAAILLSGCSAGGGGGLSAGLVARMDQPGASLNRAEALGIVNHYRSSVGSTALAADAGLDAAAQRLAADYASSGTAPRRPDGAVAMRVSAGYATFAETFSGWRNSPADAQVLTGRGATRAGLGVAYNANSTYGVYWVLILEN